MNPCEICGTVDENKPMAFKGSNHCSENHRKQIAGEDGPREHTPLDLKSKNR